jgi:hypothetical protein
LPLIKLTEVLVPHFLYWRGLLTPSKEFAGEKSWCGGVSSARPLVYKSIFIFHTFNLLVAAIIILVYQTWLLRSASTATTNRSSIQGLHLSWPQGMVISTPKLLVQSRQQFL